MRFCKWLFSGLLNADFLHKFPTFFPRWFEAFLLKNENSQTAFIIGLAH